MPRSSARGANTLAEVEILSLTPHALWLLVRGKEQMLDYEHFPWFRTASIEQVQQVELRLDHLYWPSLDIDLHVDSLERPDHFPLVSKTPTTTSTTRRR